MGSLNENRPDPDALLREIQKTEESKQRGKLKVFLGAVAGVGKTYAMLSAAHEQLERGVDVVIGVVETHGRRETEALVEGLPDLPLREIEYRGIALKEFDLDGALERKPSLLLVDELAHTNAPGSRHVKRWQDIEEVLRAGIDVYTCVNVQHLESLNDIVAEISGVVVRETVPDSFLEEANQIEVVDVPPEELRHRLEEGKVYMPAQAEGALKSFFKEGNLIALRELALRRAAERVEADLQSYRARNVIKEPLPAGDRILVCVSASKLASRVVRAAFRLGARLHSEAVAVYVDSSRQAAVNSLRRDMASDALRLAETLGMETVVLGGEDIVGAIVSYAKANNITTIVVGKPDQKYGRDLLFGSFVRELIRRAIGMDVHIVTGESDPKPLTFAHVPKSSGWKGIAWSLLSVAVATGLCALMHDRMDHANQIMIYLLGVAFVASRHGVREAVIASALSVAAFDYFFVPPHFNFAVSDAQFVFTFMVMLAVAILITSLAAKMRNQAESAGQRERRTAALYALSREMSRSRSKREIGVAAAQKVAELFDADVGVHIVSDERGLRPIAESLTGFDSSPSERAVAQWVFDHGELAGRGTSTLPGSDGLYLPLHGTHGAVGVLALRSADQTQQLDPQQMHLLETFANQLALAMERTMLAKETQAAHLQVEAERLRNTLLNTVSHDLRTPLTVIVGAADTLLAKGQIKDLDDRGLVDTIVEESHKLERFVRSLLDMTRIESGAIQLNWDWISLEELIGVAIRRNERLLADHLLDVTIDPNVQLVHADSILLEQVLVNLIENAARHTPPKTSIHVRVMKSGGFVRVVVADEGPGLPDAQEDAIFEKFQRGPDAKVGTGFGLGLSICRGIMKALNGRIWARNLVEGGAAFIFELPAERPPQVLHPTETEQ